MKKILFTLITTTLLSAGSALANDGQLVVIGGEEYCVPTNSRLAFKYDYQWNGTNHKYTNVVVLDLYSGVSDVYAFVGRQGSFGRLIFKAQSQNLQQGDYYYATDDMGSNRIGFIKQMDSLGNVVTPGTSIKVTYNLSSSYKVWVNCH